MKIKLFRNSSDIENIEDIEYDVNEWLNKNKDIEIKEFKQSFDDYELVYTFLYYEKQELRKVKLDKINEL